MSRGRDSDYEPSAPYYPEQNVFGPNNPYAQVPPSSPFLASDPSLPDLRTPPQRFVSSPLKPRAAGGDRTASTPPRDTSWTGFGPNDRGQDYPNSPEGSSRSSHAEKEQMKGILAGNVGGSFTPYPSLVRVSQSQSSSRTPSQSLILPPPHNRFSSGSSVGSVLSFMTDSKYASSTAAFLPDKFSDAGSILPVDQYGAYERLDGPADDDDFIHEPGSRNIEISGTPWRGIGNFSVLAIIVLALVALFAGYPIASHYTQKLPWKNAKVNGTGQIPDLFQLPFLIDPMTPEDQLTRQGFDGQDYVLVFSDEFETPGRTFYPGDDPFWEAVDLWYWPTGDLEWYDPGQITTRDGKLVIVVEQQETNGLQFKSGMLQSWNKFCFTTGYIEVSVVFPGNADSSGYWPGAWVMGNLGRPGYGATTDGLWPYSYDSCDVGTLPNQTLNGQPAIAATAGGNPKYNNNLSWQGGQRLSACTCPGEDHPGPNLQKPRGRASPEIDIFEAQKNKQGSGGRVSQSVQMAPFSNLYYFPNTSTDVTINNPNATHINSYRGSALQQAISALTDLNSTTFAEGGAQFTKFGIEYWSDPNNRQNGFINWVADQPVFRIDANTFSGDSTVNISNRLIPEEPLSIILNLAISESFQFVNLSSMVFPAEFLIDYVRVWQRKGLTNAVGCDPPDYPTAKYINDHPVAYTNPQLMSWASANGTVPKNSLIRVKPGASQPADRDIEIVGERWTEVG